jgi:hypothetical protein
VSILESYGPDIKQSDCQLLKLLEAVKNKTVWTTLPQMQVSTVCNRYKLNVRQSKCPMSDSGWTTTGVS